METGVAPCDRHRSDGKNGCPIRRLRLNPKRSSTPKHVDVKCFPSMEIINYRQYGGDSIGMQKTVTVWNGECSVMKRVTDRSYGEYADKKLKTPRLQIMG